MLSKKCWLLSIILMAFCHQPIGFAQEQPLTDKTDLKKLATELAAAKNHEERLTLLETRKEMVSIKLQRALIDESNRFVNQGDYDKGLDILYTAQKISEQLGDKAGISLVMNNTGIVLQRQGNYKGAVELYQKSLSLSEEAKDKDGISRALNGIGIVHYLQGDQEMSLEYFQKSLAMREELNDKDGSARLLNNIATINASVGNYGKAMEYFQKSLALHRELNNKPEIAGTLTNIGNIYNYRGDYGKAMECFESSLALDEELKRRPGIANTLNNIAYIHNAQGNYSQALKYYRKSLVLWEDLKHKAGISITLGNIANINSSQGNFRQAMENHLKSLAISEELQDKNGIAATLNNIGIIFDLQGNYEQALDYYQRGLTISEGMKDKNNIASITNNIGIIYQRLGKYERAMGSYRKSLALHEELNQKDSIADTLNSLGDLYKDLGEYEQALQHFQKSLAIREELENNAGIASALSNIAVIYRSQDNHEKALEFANRSASIARSIGRLETLWKSYIGVGLDYWALNKLDQAQKAFEEAINIIETTRSQAAGGEQAQLSFFQERLLAYNNMVDLLTSQNNNSEALSYAEQAKARVLLDVLQSGKINISKAMTTQEQAQERTFKNRLVSLNTQLYREKQRENSDAARISNLENELDKARLDFEAFQTSLYAAHPDLKTQRAEVKPVTLEEASSLLPNPQSALLEFVVAEEKTFLFVITQTTKPAKAGALRRVSQQPEPSSPILKVYTIDVKQKDLAERVRSFREMLAKKELGFRKPGRELYDLLIKPAEEQLKGITTLVIVPEGVLWELPFQALTTPQKRYLLEDCTLYYSPSLTALREMSKPRKQDSNDKPTTKTLLAFGNPSLGDESKKSAASVLLGENLEPLPGAEEQVKLLARLYGIKQSKYYIGPEAREQQVKAEAGDYRILQFATHGILNDISPMYSHLVLSQTDDKSDEDGLLEAWEIMQMDLRADLVVLAACETARGRVGAGEGVIGLTWAMFVAGCPTTVVSQWKVEDDATKDLMLEFHRLLKLKYQSAGARSRMTKAEALRQAALKMLKSGREPHPFYWAGFVMTGSGN